MHGKILEVKEREETLQVIKALASESRLEILELLKSEEMNLNQISEELDMPAPSVTVNIKKLEEAGLIETNYQPGDRGSQKLCSRNYDSILVRFPDYKVDFDTNLVETVMPIGNYNDFSVEPSCGLATEDGYVGILDDERAFLEPEHTEAQLLWFNRGFVNYKLPNNLPSNATAHTVEISMEICSEAPGFNENWPSDITLWLNGVEIGTWTSPGDFGKERGNLNPDWWNAGLTQYGLLKVWSVNEQGTYIDGKKISEVTISELELQTNNFIDLKIGVKEEARNIGGINLFGRKFGNYEQDIIFRCRYDYEG